MTSLDSTPPAGSGINEIMAALPAIYHNGKCIKILPHNPTQEDFLVAGMEDLPCTVLMGAVTISSSPMDVFQELDIFENQIKASPSHYCGRAYGRIVRGRSYLPSDPSNPKCFRDTSKANDPKPISGARYLVSGATLVVCPDLEAVHEAERILCSKYPSYVIHKLARFSARDKVFPCPNLFFESDIVIVAQNLVTYANCGKRQVLHPRYLERARFPDNMAYWTAFDLFGAITWETVVQLHVTQTFDRSLSYRNLVVIRDIPNVDGQELADLVLQDPQYCPNGDDRPIGPPHQRVTCMSDVEKILSEIAFPPTMIHRHNQKSTATTTTTTTT